MPKYQRPARQQRSKIQPWCEVMPPADWVYPYDPPEIRKAKVLLFLQERRKAIAERDLENVFCYTFADVTWTIKHLLKEGKIKREIMHFGSRKVAFVSAL
jgi:hypothetical protein